MEDSPQSRNICKVTPRINQRIRLPSSDSVSEDFSAKYLSFLAYLPRSHRTCLIPTPSFPSKNVTSRCALRHDFVSWGACFVERKSVDVAYREWTDYQVYFGFIQSDLFSAFHCDVSNLKMSALHCIYLRGVEFRHVFSSLPWFSCEPLYTSSYSGTSLYKHFHQTHSINIRSV